MSDPINFRAAKAERTGDSRDWTARDALEDVLRRIDAGEINPERLMIHWQEAKPDGGWNMRYTVAGVMFHDHIALLEAAKHFVIHDWIE